MRISYLLICIALVFASCTPQQEANKASEVENWRLGWRMIQSSWNEENPLAEQQFDSLLNRGVELDYKFLITGLELLDKSGQEGKVLAILNQQKPEMLSKLCNSDLLKGSTAYVNACADIEIEGVQHPGLQLELIKMYVDDQAARKNIMKNVIEKYALNEDNISTEDATAVDWDNRNRLKKIFEEYGFPTKEMVGKDAMHGIFLMIQHSDGETEWQKSQLPNIEKAVKMGDMNGQAYAYLYDRIKINGGEKQLYGTQFSNVDPINMTVTLAETENIDSLDYRRMEVGMMPIDIYKVLMLTTVSK